MMVVITHFIATMIGALIGIVSICLMQASRHYEDEFNTEYLNREE